MAASIIYPTQAQWDTLKELGIVGTGIPNLGIVLVAPQIKRDLDERKPANHRTPSEMPYIFNEADVSVDAIDREDHYGYDDLAESFGVDVSERDESYFIGGPLPDGSKLHEPDWF